TQAALAIEDDNLGRASDAEALRTSSVEVLEKGKLDIVLDGLRSHRADGIIRSDIDREELHALRTIRFLQAVQRWQVALDEGAGRVGEDEDDRLAVAEIVEGTQQVTNVLEREIADAIADLDRGLQCRRGCGE